MTSSKVVLLVFWCVLDTWARDRFIWTPGLSLFHTSQLVRRSRPFQCWLLRRRRKIWKKDRPCTISRDRENRTCIKVFLACFHYGTILVHLYRRKILHFWLYCWLIDWFTFHYFDWLNLNWLVVRADDISLIGWWIYAWLHRIRPVSDNWIFSDSTLPLVHGIVCPPYEQGVLLDCWLVRWVESCD